MNYISEAEERLKNYRILVKSIYSLKKDIERLHHRVVPSQTGAQTYDSVGVKVSKKKRDAYDDIYEYAQLNDHLQETEQAVKSIDNALRHVSKEPGCAKYEELLRMWYIGIQEPDDGDMPNFTRYEREEVAGILHTEIRAVYVKKEKAIKKFAILLFGIKAL